MSKPISIEALKQQSPTFATFSLAKAESNFSNDPKKFMEMVSIKVSNKVARISITGNLTMDGINVSDEYQTHSFPVDLDDITAEAVEQLNELFATVDGLSEYSQTHLLNNSKIWVKCKYTSDKSSYKFQSNVKLNPKRPVDAQIHTNDCCEIIGEIFAYFNVKDKSFGLSLKPLKINFNAPE